MNWQVVFDKKPCCVKWVEAHSSLREMWDNCPDGSWLWWGLEHLRGSNHPEWGYERAFMDYCMTIARVPVSLPPWYRDGPPSVSSQAEYIAWKSSCDAASALEGEAYRHDWNGDTDRANLCLKMAGERQQASYAAEARLQADWIREHVEYPITSEETK
jgi:hypothetical protein